MRMAGATRTAPPLVESLVRLQIKLCEGGCGRSLGRVLREIRRAAPLTNHRHALVHAAHGQVL